MERVSNTYLVITSDGTPVAVEVCSWCRHPARGRAEAVAGVWVDSCGQESHGSNFERDSRGR